MKDTSISNLLNEDSLPTDRAVATKQRRFKCFIRVVLNAWKGQHYWTDPASKTQGQDNKK